MHGKKILFIVANEGIDTTDIEHNLKLMDYAMHVIVGVDKAIKTALEIMPDIILIDTSFNIDEKDLDLIKNLNIPIIFLLNKINESFILKDSNKEFFGVIVKPFSQSDFRNAIDVGVYKHEMDSRLKEIEVSHRNMLENLQDAYFQVNTEGNIVLTNPFSALLFGYDSPSEMHGLKVILLIKNLKDRDLILDKLNNKNEIDNYQFKALKRDDTSFWASFTAFHQYDDFGNIKAINVFIRDITPQMKAEFEQETFVEFIHIMNNSVSVLDLINSTINFIKQRSGFEAVAVRLKQGVDYPYYQTIGFSNEFIQMENHLCDYNEKGNPYCDGDGNPILECMCGNVISRRYNSLKQFFTDNGSFWTNSTTELLSNTTEEDRQTRTRNRCNGEGYESVALIPLISGDETIGLLQLNDKRKNLFSLDNILVWERLAGYLAISLAKFQAEELKQNLLENEQKLSEELKISK